jgi:hypothetical protein
LGKTNSPSDLSVFRGRKSCITLPIQVLYGMTYRLTIGSNKRIILLIVLSSILPLVGILAAIYLGVAGYIILGAGVLISYQSFKYIRYNLRSRVVTHDEGLSVFVPGGEPLRFLWTEITHAGLCTRDNGKRAVFVYEEESDKFVSIPDEYEGFDGLQAELRTRIDTEKRGEFHEFTLGPKEEVKDRIRALLGLG